MNPIRRLRVTRILLVALLGPLAGCAYTPLTPLGEQIRVDSIDTDEAHLWKHSRSLQHAIESSGMLLEDPALDAYLARVLARVTPPELATAGLEPRVQVVSDVQMHAYSFANGVIYVHTGLLARMENETQLATMLSRELAHVVHRHSLRAHRDRRGQADALAWFGVAATTFEGGSNAKLLLQAASISSQVGFHYILETEADSKGLATLAAAGYDPGAAPAFFQQTVEYQAELHGQGPYHGWPFVAPVRMTTRIAGYEALLASEYAETRPRVAPIADPPEFRRLVHPATLRQAELELAAGLPASAEKTARLATESDPRDPRGWVLLGRALDAQRKKPIANRPVPESDEVRAAFRQALALDRRHADATRELGMTYYRESDGADRSAESKSEALRHLRSYLRLAPDAKDASYIRSYIQRLDGREPGR